MFSKTNKIELKSLHNDFILTCVLSFTGQSGLPIQLDTELRRGAARREPRGQRRHVAHHPREQTPALTAHAPTPRHATSRHVERTPCNGDILLYFYSLLIQSLYLSEPPLELYYDCQVGIYLYLLLRGVIMLAVF